MISSILIVSYLLSNFSSKSNDNYSNDIKENFSFQSMPNLDAPEDDIQDCKCRRYYDDHTKSWLYDSESYKKYTNDKCQEYLDFFLSEYNDVCPKTIGEYTNWCHSYRRRLYMFPKLKHAQEKFKLFHDVNKNTY